MLKLLFIFLLIGFSFLQASLLEINYADKKFDDFSLSYFQDTNASQTIQSIKNVHFKSIKNRHGISKKEGLVWYKLELKNSTAINKEFFLHDKYAYFSQEIKIYEFLDKRLIKQDRYNILEDKETNKLEGGTLVYTLRLAPHQSKTIIIQNNPMISNFFDLSKKKKKSSLQTLMTQDFESVLIIAIMLTLALYNATLYFFNRKKEFLLYALYMITPTLGLMYKYGILFSFFQLYGSLTYWFNLTAILMPAFLIIFVKEVLNTKKMRRRVDVILNSVLFLIFLDLLVALLVDLSLAMESFKIIFLFTTTALIYLGLHLFKITHPLARIFALAYGFYLLGLIITILAMSGVTALTSFSFHSGGIGIVLEGLLFSYLVHNNINTLEEKIRVQRDAIIQKNKKEQLGEMISAITHQWKQPLARISSVTSLLVFNFSNKTEIPQEEIQKKMAAIETDVQFLSHTIDDFRDFFSETRKVESCNIGSLIESAIKIIQDDSLSSEIEIKTDIELEKNIDIIKNELFHILINILQNAREAFKNSKERVKLIKIIAYNKEGKLYIDIVDNAGGIKEGTIPLIFDEHYTTKQDKSGAGLGLYLSSVIMKEHLKGQIEAINIPGGTMFRIIL